MAISSSRQYCCTRGIRRRQSAAFYFRHKMHPGTNDLTFVTMVNRVFTLPSTCPASASWVSWANAAAASCEPGCTSASHTHVDKRTQCNFCCQIPSIPTSSTKTGNSMSPATFLLLSRPDCVLLPKADEYVRSGDMPSQLLRKNVGR